MFCSHCGKELTDDARYCAQCGAPVSAAPAADLPGRRHVGLVVDRPPVPLYAGFWKRFAAYLIDWVLIVVASGVLGLALGFGLGSWDEEGAAGLAAALGQIAGIVISWLYYAVMESGARQATLGKQAIAIRVTDYRGERIGFGRASARYFAQILSALPFMIGYMMAGWTRRKQALHDILAGCLVVNREALPEAIRADNEGRSSRAGLVALVLVAGGVLIAGFVTAIGIPLYEDYTTRARVAAAIAQVDPARREFEAYYARNRAMPSDIAEVWSAELPESVDGLSIGSGGSIELVLGLRQVEGKKILLVPSVDSGGRLTWTCASEEIEPRWLPDECAGDSSLSR